MIRTEDLYELIKSLTPSEKRYFKLYSSFAKKSEDNNYIKLFEVIDKIHNPDNISELIQKKLKKISFDSNFPATRTYLHNLILKSLKSYNNHSTSDKIENMLQDVRILFGKALYTQTNEILDKLEELAQQEEKYHHLLEVYLYRGKMTRYSVNETEKDYLERNKIIFEQYKSVLSILNQQTEYNLLFNELNELYVNHKMIRSEEISEKFNAILAHSLFTSKEIPKSFEAHKLFYMSHIIAASFKGELNKENELCFDLLLFLEKKPEKIKTNFAFYTSTIRNYINSSLHLYKTENLDSWINKYQDLSKTYPNAVTQEKERIMRLMSIDFMLNFYISNNQFKDADLYIKENLEKITELLDSKQYKVNTQSRVLAVEIYYAIAYIGFANAHNKESLRWLNKIEQEIQKDNFIQLQIYARLLKLILLFELDDFYIDHSIRSTYRFLLKQNRLLKFEKTIIDCLRHIPKFNSADELHKFYELVSNNLKPLWEDKTESRNLHTLNLLAWAESKLQKKSFAETVHQYTPKIAN